MLSNVFVSVKPTILPKKNGTKVSIWRNIFLVKIVSIKDQGEKIMNHSVEIAEI